MDGALATALRDWSTQAPYGQPQDWVFASPRMKGTQPYWPETPLKCFVVPAAKRLGIAKQIGWHSFRRTFATLLKGSGEDVKVVQELTPREQQTDTRRVRASLDASKEGSAFEGCRDDSANHRNPSCSFVFPRRKAVSVSA